MKRRLLMTVLLLVIAVRQSNGYSKGAPDTACTSLFPRHGPNSQTSPSPYTITPLQVNVGPGEVLSLKLEAASEGFRGFIIQAHNPTSQTFAALGTFTNSTGNNKIVTCTPGFQNTLTHGDAKSKNSMLLNWKAPSDYEGDVQFRCTFVKDYNTFWTLVPATKLVRVGRSAVTPAYQPATTYNRDQSSFPYTTPTTIKTTTTTKATTTTRPASTSPVTPPWSFAKPTAAPSSAQLQIPQIYAGCGDLKGCFSLPDSSCISEGSCTSLVTYSLKGQRYEFELWAYNAQPNSYVAVGFSEDNFMGEDSVTECTLVSGRVGVFMSYNEGKNNKRLRDSSSGLKVLQTNYSDGNLYCRFERQPLIKIGDKTFDLTKPYQLLLARGSASENGVGYHDRQKTVSARQVSLAETGSVGASKGTLIKLHGAFMVAAWMFAASCGILFARYFRLTWVGKQFKGKDYWFVAHRILMSVTWLLTILAFILIFIELGGWTSLPATTNPHAVIGVVTTCLAFIQPFMAYFRPHPGTPKRFIFNWAHWLVGNSAHILGIVCIFLAVDLDKAAVPYWVNWLLVTYVAIHAISHLVLSLAQCCYHSDGSRKPAAVFAMRDLAPHQSNQNHFYSTQQDKKEDAHGSTFRQIMLFFYIVLVASFSAAVIGTIVNGPWPKQ